MPILNDNNLIGYFENGSYKQFTNPLSVKIQEGNDNIDLSNLLTTIITYVKTSDIDEVNYVTGSENQIKSIMKYNNTLSTGQPSLLTTFFYQDSDVASSFTKAVQSESVIP